MSSAKKATIYVDVDDEITTLIDKVIQSKEKIVALVLPKRASMLQSIVNMKLLKRSADDAGKKIVLITSESVIMPLAGAVGLYVAKTLQSKPAVPPAPDAADDKPETAEVEDVDIDKSAPVGALAGLKDEDDVETAEVPEEAPVEAAAGSKAAKTTPKNRKLKIPNFNKFRLKLILGVILLLLLIGGWVTASTVLPRAEIVVKTDTKTFSKDLTATASPNVNEVDVDNKVVPAKTEELIKKDTETVPASGEVNKGKKATGKMTLTNCIDDGKSHTVPKGTSFSRNGKTFVTDSSVTLGEAYFQGGDCKSDQLPSAFGTQKDVAVTAAEGGTGYNLSEGSYTASIAGIDAYGSDMKGGTDNIIKVVSQKDIDTAKQKLREKTSEGTVEDLKALLTGQGYIPFESTYEEGEAEVDTSVEPGTEAKEVTVTSTATYKMSGALKSALDAIVVKAAEADIDTELQNVTETGIDKATIRVSDKKEDGTMTLTIETLVTAGPQLNEALLKSQVLGKKRGETQSILESKAGVTEVIVDYSPFWVHSTPSSENKVKLTVENPSDTVAPEENADTEQ